MSAIWPKILCVHRDVDMLRYLEICCRKNGEFIGVTSGTEALHYLGQDQVDIVVTGLHIGSLDGYELSRTIREDARLADLPIILTSSLREYEFKKKGIESGATYILGQPFSPNNLKAYIQAVLHDKTRQVS